MFGNILRCFHFMIVTSCPMRCLNFNIPQSLLGKHGHAKVHMVGIDIFNGKKYEDICPSTHNMDVPHVKREDYQLTDIDDGFLVLMSDGGDLREDLKIPEGELGVQLRAEYDAGKELLVSCHCYAESEEIKLIKFPF
jgi:translation initiation factor 5A